MISWLRSLYTQFSMHFNFLIFLNYYKINEASAYNTFVSWEDWISVSPFPQHDPVINKEYQYFKISSLQELILYYCTEKSEDERQESNFYVLIREHGWSEYKSCVFEYEYLKMFWIWMLIWTIHESIHEFCTPRWKIAFSCENSALG